MDNYGINVNRFMFEWLNYMKIKFNQDNTVNLEWDNTDFKTMFEVYVEMKQLEKTPSLKRRLIHNRAFMKWIRQNEVFKMCELNDPQNNFYKLYGKSMGNTSWRMNKRKYNSLLTIIDYMKETFKIYDEDETYKNVLIESEETFIDDNYFTTYS